MPQQDREERQNRQSVVSHALGVFRPALVALTLTLWAVGPSLASDVAHMHGADVLRDTADIRKLTICYAHGTDAIGRGDLEAGKALYQACFTKDAAISAFFPDGQGEKRTGPEAWADFVLSVFKNAGYTVTQHLLGTIDVEVKGETAIMSSYLHATHVLPNGSIDVANGTYVDEVIKTPGGWRIRSRTLTLITFLNLASPAAPSKLLSQ